MEASKIIVYYLNGTICTKKILIADVFLDKNANEPNAMGIDYLKSNGYIFKEMSDHD